MSPVRWAGVAALLGGVLCLVLTPIQAHVWGGAEAPPLVLAARPLLDQARRLHAVVGPRLGLTDYYFYGRMFFLVYLLAMTGLIGLHARQSRAGGRWEKVWFRALLGALVVASTGDVVAYWGGTDLGDLQGLGFTVEVLALLPVLVSSAFYGRVTLRSNAVPRWSAWLLILAGPAAILGVFVTRYVPHGAVLPFSLAVAVVGFFLLAREPDRASANPILADA
jgi:hypothetical protein